MIGIHYADAKEVATKMENAADSLQQAMEKVILKAEKTNVKVNTTAQDTNERAITLSRSFHQHFQQTIEDIQTVATEFKRIDQETSASMDKSVVVKKANEYLNIR